MADLDIVEGVCNLEEERCYELGKGYFTITFYFVARTLYIGGSIEFGAGLLHLYISVLYNMYTIVRVNKH